MSSRSYIIPAEDLTFAEKSEYRLNALAAAIARAYVKKIGDPQDIAFRNSQGVLVPVGPQPGFADVKRFLLENKGWPPGTSLDVREFQPILDAGTVLDQWNTAALAAAGTEYSIFQAIPVPAIALRVNKLVVWYKVQSLTTPLSVSRLIFRRTAAAGPTMYEFDLEQLCAAQRLDGYFSEPVIWDPSIPYVINAMAKGMPAVSTGLVAEIVPGNFVIEPAGQVNQ